MILKENLSFDEIIRRSREACSALSDEDDGLKREILTHAGNRWSLGIVYALGAEGTLRHAQLARRPAGVTQRMLTRTLRQLERDGLISRRDYRTVPPRVEYDLTDLGRGLLQGMMPLWTWIVENGDAFKDARRRFENGSKGEAFVDQ